MAWHTAQFLGIGVAVTEGLGTGKVAGLVAGPMGALDALGALDEFGSGAALGVALTLAGTNRSPDSLLTMRWPGGMSK